MYRTYVAVERNELALDRQPTKAHERRDKRGTEANPVSSHGPCVESKRPVWLGKCTLNCGHHETETRRWTFEMVYSTNNTGFSIPQAL